jgi:hypothetical protein
VHAQAIVTGSEAISGHADVVQVGFEVGPVRRNGGVTGVRGRGLELGFSIFLESGKPNLHVGKGRGLAVKRHEVSCGERHSSGTRR